MCAQARLEPNDVTICTSVQAKLQRVIEHGCALSELYPLENSVDEQRLYLHLDGSCHSATVGLTQVEGSTENLPQNHECGGCRGHMRGDAF